MLKKLLFLFLILTFFMGVLGIPFLQVANAKTCEEGYWDCVERYGDTFWGWMYCNIGYIWCIKYYE
ncbi:MAG: hypothetical protein ABIN61_08885 [candidate division WOR-3 bacterium]